MSAHTTNNSQFDALLSLLAAKAPETIALSDRVWGMPETCYAEHRSAAEHLQMLEQEGFRITKDLAGISTAMMGEAGSGGPLIALLGEFDALANLSQEAGVAEAKPLVAGHNGHGCGHNLLGSASMLAAIALKDWLAQTGTPGRVRYYGCPAEEGGAAKSFMVKAGAFDDVDIALTWHPAEFMEVVRETSLANCRIDFTFSGTASHAGMAPHLGRSALDAAELMNVGVNYLREHVPTDCRMHYAYLNAGGISPNVVQAVTKLRYVVRAPDRTRMLDLVERVKKVAQGAAMMTETTVSSTMISAVSNLVSNRPLEEAMQDVMEQLGPPEFDAADRDFAESIRRSLSEADIGAAWQSIGQPARPLPLCDFVVEASERRAPGGGSTDLGDVSWVVPTVQAHSATCAIGTQLHTWQMVAQGKSPIAHKGMVRAAEVLAATATRIYQDANLRQRAKEALKEATRVAGYTSPLPDGAQPPIQEMAALATAP
ncbi:M20 family metallopeptidase [Devosia sp. 1635]|uniref:M20 family metallopeptidase n=1 Tax=Devosia sp. 1635 TaxID=2726066 RepID=UPI0015655B46|nr:M20 family metallopeptidase [Devosia sp. 1635]